VAAFDKDPVLARGGLAAERQGGTHGAEDVGVGVGWASGRRAFSMARAG
jgi:hypothetical protein